MGISDLSTEERQTIIEHFKALRKSIIISLIAIIIAAIIAFNFSDEILSILIKPLSDINEVPVVTGVTEAFYVKLKIAFFSGFILAFPVVIWAIWRFLKPALYPSERKYLLIIFPISLILFTVGILFSYFIVLRIIIEFFILMAGENIGTMLKIDEYISFIIGFVIPFGLIFQLPVLVYFLTKIGVIKYEKIRKSRKYALLVIVVVSAVLTPPDPISNLLMSIPTYLLYELSIIIAKFSTPDKERKEKGNKLFFWKKKPKADENETDD